jgi:ribosomal protein L12E/L44/L45/RPP1/RPP2
VLSALAVCFQKQEKKSKKKEKEKGEEEEEEEEEGEKKEERGKKYRSRIQNVDMAGSPAGSNRFLSFS